MQYAGILEHLPLLAYFLPVLCCFCYGLMLIFRRESRVKRIFGFVMLMAALCYTMSLLYDTMVQQDGRVPICNVWHMGSVLMMCPIIGWYFALLIRPDAQFYPHYLLLSIPFILSVIGTILFLRFAPHTPNVYSIRDFIGLWGYYPEARYRMILTVVFVVEIAYIFIRTELQLKAHRERIQHDFSNTDKVDLSWVQILVGMTLFCCLLNMVYAFTSSVQLRTIYNILFFVAITGQCVYGSSHSDVYYLPTPEGSKKQRYPIPPEAVPQHPPDTEQKKIISPAAREKIRKNMVTLLERDEIYCQPNLRLIDLAEMLHTNRTYVSVVINESFQTNFCTLINRYRIKKAVELMNDKTLKIKDVWMQAGFTSQTVFNTMFKKEMQVTPAEWMRRMESEE